MVRLRQLLVCVTFLVVHITPVRVEAQTWSEIGPEGGPLRDITVAGPSTVYATGATGGLFKTTNGGDSWQPISAGLCDVHVSAIVIPAGSKTIYVGTDSGGICTSTNGGATWVTPKNFGLPVDGSGFLPAVRALTADSSGVLNLAASTGLYHSTNGSGSWAAVTNITSAISVIAAPSLPSTIYASAVDALGVNGIYKSTNSGSTWKEVNNTLNKAGAISVDPSNATILYLASDTVYRSTDSGTTWAPFNTGLSAPYRVTRVVFSPADPKTLFTLAVGGCGFCRSSQGSAWAAVPETGLPPYAGAAFYNGAPLWIEAIAFDSATAQVMYAATGFGFYRSTDAGATWTESNTGIHSFDVTATALTGGDPSFIAFATVAGTAGGKVPYGGTATWRTPGDSASPIDPNGFTFVNQSMFVWMAADPNDAITAYAIGLCGSLYKTSDSGVSWPASPGPISGCSGTGMTIVADPMTSGTLYATGRVDATRVGVYRTTTGGSSWTPAAGLPNGPITALAVSKVRPGRLYATGSNRFYTSTDGGVNWTTTSSAIFADPTVLVERIAIDPGNDAIAYIATTNGVSRTSDSGISWVTESNGWPSLNGKVAPAAAIAVDPILPTTVYASPGTPFDPWLFATAALGTGLYKSIDSGATWTLVPETAGYIVNHIQIDAHRAAFAATNNGLLRLDLTTTVTTDQSALVFNALTLPAAFSSNPPPQIVQLTESGFGGVPWTATSNKPWLIVSPSSSTGPGPLTISVQFVPGLTTTQTGTITISAPGAAGPPAPITVTLNTIPKPTSVALDRTALTFGATTTGAAFSANTPAQIVRLTEDGAAPVPWTATSNQPWLLVSPGSGGGSGSFSISVRFMPGLAATQSGTITIAAPGAVSVGGPITVTLNTIQAGTSHPAFGSFDTPVDGSAGVAGSIAVTGWALDDVAVTRVRVMREAVPGEGTGLVFIGNAVQIEGARPDVAAAFPSTPRNTTGGWGYLLLTNFLPNQGNGTVVLHALVDDADGNITDLGAKTITCANSTSTNPFGAIDTPGQGETVSGAIANFGWTLIRNTGTPTPRADVPGGASVNVFVDGVSVGSPTGWTGRADLSALFPSGYSDLTSTLAVFGLDTTTLSNGVHTIAWGVGATNGQGAGIGSRFFTVSNGALTLDPSSRAATVAGSEDPPYERAAGDVRAFTDPITGRRGFDLDAPYRSYFPGADGTIVVQGEELDRVELLVNASAGWLRTSRGLEPLPIGSHLDRATGVFTWSPGVGFVGAYDLVFVRAGLSTNVRIVLNPKGSARVGPQIVIDAPARGASVPQRFALGGWAADLGAASGTGVGTIHVWAYPTGGGDPVFLGVAESGARPDVAAIYGEQFRDSGYGLIVNELPPGTYDLAVFGWSVANRGFLPAKVVRVTVQ